MKVELGLYKEEPVGEPKTEINLKLIDNGYGVFHVNDTQADYMLIGFKLVDGKLNFIRYEGVMGPQFNTNSLGQLEEVSE